MNEETKMCVITEPADLNKMFFLSHYRYLSVSVFIDQIIQVFGSFFIGTLSPCWVTYDSISRTLQPYSKMGYTVDGI